MSGHGGAGDHRKLPRRRGEELEKAILQATLDELAETGFAGMTIERIAERARTGKASVYRRWPSRYELAMAAIYRIAPDPASPPDTGTLRGDLLALLRATAAMLSGPGGEAMRGLVGDVLRDEKRMARIREVSQGSGRRAVEEVTRRAVARGEIDAAAVTTRRLETGQALLRQHFLFNGAPIPDTVILEIVDEVLVPLFTNPL
ncbi:MAG: TetR family transcriptional regulator [Streptosporangiales bacterium]|nr:TetR family transcriptional regulator [Streptosporangiales bacterium]